MSICSVYHVLCAKVEMTVVSKFGTPGDHLTHQLSPAKGTQSAWFAQWFGNHNLKW